MPLKDRRDDYSWPQTKINSVRLVTDKKSYALGDSIAVNVSFRVVGGLREAFHPDVWTVAWEDFDKRLRLTLKVSVGMRRTVTTKKVAELAKAVRIASFYWSRDPDLPYRIWAMIMPEDGGPPQLPRNVEDAKSKMLDVEKSFKVPAASLGTGKKQLVARVGAKWGRRSFIEKGSLTMSSKPVLVVVE